MANSKLAYSNYPEILPELVESDGHRSACLPEKTLMVSLSGTEVRSLSSEL